MTNVIKHIITYIVINYSLRHFFVGLMICGLNGLPLMYKYIYFPINIHVAVSYYFIISNKGIIYIFVRRHLYYQYRVLLPYVYLLTITSINLFTFIVNRFSLNLVLITLCVIIYYIITQGVFLWGGQ